MNPTPAALADITPGALVVLVGPAGSGKSTLLRAANIPAHQIVSLDHLRAVVSEPGDQDATADAVLLQDQILIARLRRGVTTFADNTSLVADHRIALAKLAADLGRPSIAVLVDTPLDLCIARNARRPPCARVPEDVLRNQHGQLAAARAALPTEGFTEIRHHA
ncbi:AAA family ATPase [Kitasatospora sp. NPDC059160]|uniref:AAA family ATPase n=1 Tax=Kitasatospora sp. NPDC059160 TaxID=3346748 RepID=UPI0036C63A90